MISRGTVCFTIQCFRFSFLTPCNKLTHHVHPSMKKTSSDQKYSSARAFCAFCGENVFFIVMNNPGLASYIFSIFTSVPIQLKAHDCLFRVAHFVVFFNPFTPDSAMSKIDQFSKITNWVKLKTKQHHSKVLPNSFQTNGHALGFCSWNQKLENFVSSKVSLWESQG